MNFTMKHREYGSCGSFTAWGVGLEYEYDAGFSALNIIHSRKNKPLMYVDCDERLAQEPLSFIAAMEKATQLNALVISNNKTIDLSEILEEQHLKTMLKAASYHAGYSCDLQRGAFNAFEERFCKAYCLHKICLNRSSAHIDRPRYYSAELKTNTQNSITSYGANLSSVIRSLSKKTVHDLVNTGFGHITDIEAQNLLAVSSNLSLISKILDKNFHPMHKIRQINTKIKR